MPKKHPRVTDEGIALGLFMSKLAELGRKLLKTKGLELDLPVMRDDMCASCACRAGTIPNGCLQTQFDILKTVIDGKKFLCHAPLDGRLCTGWVYARAAHAANPIPQEMQALIEQYEYSPPDDEA